MKTLNERNAKAFAGVAQTVQCLVAIAVLAATAANGQSAESKAPASGDGLVGTWKLVSATYGGQISELPDTITTVKHVTPTQFMWVSYDEDEDL